ncbi:hypothetical protein FPOA_06510 [Fusarium poae]|uniref:Zn(2)-C6 fungal-type domain-containing protein n=1 Tax=Fusarium poae TaxID=36050 RepID=A0A1B8AZR0_FUSPO|nr:hypothetical protein FPOA_06510 [Fusarium poae]
MHNHQRLRPLQPATSATDYNSSPGPSLSSSASGIRARKTFQVPACDVCRRRKKKCDRGRPTCSNCAERGLECEYILETGPAASPLQLERLTRATKEPGALAELFKTLPYHDALELLHLLREMPVDAPSQETIETSASPSPSPLPFSSSTTTTTTTTTTTPPSLWSHFPLPSQHSIVGSLLPPVSCPLDLELMVRHPIAYPVLLPLMPTSLPLDELLVPRTLELLGPPLGQLPPHSSRSQSSPDINMTQDDSASTDFYKRLPHLTEFIVDLLNQVDISLWTSLPIPNHVAVHAIALYLNNDYPVLPLFDADLFLRDLVHNQPYFCSTFLVTTLLAWAFQAYTPIHAEAAHYSYACFVDARAQWSKYGDRESITLCNVSALQLLCMTAVSHGKDDLALEYLREGLKVAQTMGLLNLASGTEVEDAWFSGYTEWVRAASYTAWGAFNWISVFSLHYHVSEIAFPPRIPLPGDVDAAIAGEDSNHALPSSNVDVFMASSRLWTIFLAVTKAYYGKDRYISLDRDNALTFAEGVYQQLLDWADKLPISLVRRPDSSHATFMLHIYYHAIITDLFRPFLHLSTPSTSTLRTFQDQASATVIYYASIRQMKRLLLSYRLEFDLQAASFLWQTCIICVANATVRDTECNPDERLFFLKLCLAGLEEMFLSFRIFGCIKKAVLVMAFYQGVLDQDEMHRNRGVLEAIYQRYVADEGDQKMEETNTGWIVDLDLEIMDPESAKAISLAEQFDMLCTLYQ